MDIETITLVILCAWLLALTVYVIYMSRQTRFVLHDILKALNKNKEAKK